MTITETCAPTITNTVVLDGSRLLEPRPIIEEIRALARHGADVTVNLPLDPFDRSPLTGVSRILCQAWVEDLVRNALRAAGYRNISRRVDSDTIVLVAQA
jgi:hypothetical protein